MRRIGTLLAALLIAGAASSPASGADKSELDDVEREKAEMAAELENATDEVRQAGQVLAETEARLPDAEQAIDIAEGRAAAAETQAAEAQRQADAAKAALTAAEAEFDAAAQAVEAARDAHGSTVRATYQGAELLTIDAILASGEPAQAVEGLTYLEFLNEAKRQTVEEITLKRRVAANAEGAASVAESGAAEADRAADAALAQAETRVVEAQAARDEVEQLVADRTDALAVAEAAESEAQADYEALEEESDRLADQLRGAGTGGSSGGGDSSGGSGSDFVVPVSGWKSSDFGWRTHPIYGTSRFHGGTDFAAGEGTTIHAADSGTVVHAGWSGGYGNLTCISHGGGVTSCYAHQSSLWVNNGEHVSRDEGIGAVGSTGASTGAHLHFEVRVGGERVQPLDYLPSCLCR